MAATRIAIVGGGLAGLAAGIELKDAGCTVELFERARIIGGRATSFEVDGVEVDNGQHVFLACCTEFIRFVERIGMAGELVLQANFDVCVISRGGRGRLRSANLPPPFQLLASLARYRQLNPLDRLRLTRAVLALLTNPPDGTDVRNFDRWLLDHGQNSATMQSFWEPLLVPALNAPLDKMSAADAAFVISTAFFHDRTAASIGYSRVPLAHLMEAAAARLDAVWRSTPVLDLQVGDAGVNVRTTGGERQFDAAIAAVSPRALARLLPDASASGVPDLDGYETEAIMDAHLWHDCGRLDFDFAALIGSPIQWIFQKGEGYLCCSFSAANDLVSRPSTEVTQQAWQQLQAYVPQLRGAHLIRSAVTRNPEGTFLPKPGTTRPGAATNSPRLALAGAWTATGWPDTMESAVRSGIAAAAIMMKQCAKN